MHVDIEVLEDEAIYRRLMREEIPAARHSVLIATALVKQTQVEIRKGEFGPFMQLADSLIGRGVSVSLLLAGKPSKAFLESLARFPRVASGLWFRLCARNHMKIVLIDGVRLYLGSANLTGAGMGRKSDDRRNFELGITTSDPRLIRRVSETVGEIWLQKPCRTCQAVRLCAFEHYRIQQGLNELGASLANWHPLPSWPEEVRRLRPEDVLTRRRPTLDS